MKNFAKTLVLSLIACTAIFSTAAASPRKGSDPKSKVDLYFLRGDVVSAGSVMTAELAANTVTEVDLVIENELGDSFGEKHVVIDHGAKLIRFRIADVPAGKYYVKVHHRGRVATHAFTVN